MLVVLARIITKDFGSVKLFLAFFRISVYNILAPQGLISDLKKRGGYFHSMQRISIGVLCCLRVLVVQNLTHLRYDKNGEHFIKFWHKIPFAKTFNFISGLSEVWYRAWFGTRRPWVQVP